MTWNVAITDLDMPSIEAERAELRAIGARLVRHDCKTSEDIIRDCQDADALMVQWAPVTREVIERLPRLKAISRYGIGYDMIDIEAAAERGIPVSNVPHYCMEEVATHALTLMLACARKIVPLNASVASGGWNTLQTSRPIHRLRGQTLGLVGGGRIGSTLARFAIGIGLNVLIYDPYAHSAESPGAAHVDLENLLAASDFISIHCPLTDETRGLFNEATFHKMKSSAVLINTSRGAIVNTDDLIAALRQGQIGGAALDVLEEEPPAPGTQFGDVPNLIVTPHAAWYSEESLVDLQRLTARAIVEFFETGTATSIVNAPIL